MKKQTKWKIIILLTSVLFASCGQNSNKIKGKDLTDDSYVQGLVEKQIGESDFYISIPADYTIQATNGPDFYVYYFHPTDSTIIANFSGGIYFGNHPSEFPPYNDSCTTTNSKSKIYDVNADWTIYNCNDVYSIQTIIDSKSREGWNDKIHAFGRSNTKTDLNKLLSIFTTMKKKE